MATTVFTRYATQEIAGANLLLKADGTDYVDLCDATSTPIGVSTHSCDANYVQTVRALSPAIVTLTASGAIAFGADVGLAANGKVATWTSGAKIGRAVSEASEDGDEITVALSASAVSSESSVSPSGVEVAISSSVPTVPPGVPSGTSAFALHYTTSFQGLYFWNGAAWEQLT